LAQVPDANFSDGIVAREESMSSMKNLVMTAIVLLSMKGANANAQDDTVKAIQLAEEEVNLAFNRFDATALARLWGEDLTFIFPNGTLAGKTERLAGLVTRPSQIPTSENESVDVKNYGEVAVAIVVSRWTETSDGKPFLMRYRATHVWAKRSGHWEMVSAHVSQMKN
jgi:ketosteroid isomerase-like protein